MESSKELTLRPAIPWATIAVALVAIVAWAWPALSAVLIYDRVLIFNHEIWRLWTGHLVHYGNSHLFWNLMVFIPVGCWLERLWPVMTRWFYVICPTIISIVLLLADPTLTRYAGLSGVATGAIVLLAGLQLRRRPVEPAWFWLAVLALVGLKIASELFSGTTVFVSTNEFAGIRTVPLSHLSGIGCAAIFWLISATRTHVPRAAPVG